MERACHKDGSCMSNMRGGGVKGEGDEGREWEVSEGGRKRFHWEGGKNRKGLRAPEKGGGM